MGKPEVIRLNVSEEKGEIRLGVRNGKAGLIAELCLELSEGVNISYIFVKEKERRKGIGTLLLQTALSKVSRTGMFFPVECSFPLEGNEELSAFFDAQPNMTVREEQEIYTITASDRKKLKRWKDLKKGSPNVKEFFELDAKMRNGLFELLEEDGYDAFVDAEDPLLDKKMCFASVNEGKINGAIFFSKHGKNELELSFLYTPVHNALIVGELLGCACKAADEIYPDADIWFSAVTPESAGMASGFFEGKATAQTVVTAYWNGWSLEEMEDFEQLMAQ